VSFAQYAGPQRSNTWQILYVLKRAMRVDSRHGVFLYVFPFLITALWLAIVAKARVQKGNAEADRRPSEALASQIESSLARGDLKAARRLVPKFLEEPGLTDEALLQVGVNLAQHDLYGEATEVFRRCVKDYPQVFTGSYNLALAEFALREYSMALATLRRAPRASPAEEASRTYLRGKIEMALQQNAEAERDLSAAFASAPQEENFALDLGLCYIRTGKYQDAVETFRTAIPFHENSPFLRLGLALAQYLRGLNAESVETCRAVLAVHPDFSPARVMMAFALYMEGKAEAAAQLAAEGLQGPNPFPYLYYIHAVSLLRLRSQNYATIVSDLTQAARSIPRCSLCYVAVSKAHRRKGELTLATADLEKAVRLDPTLGDAWYNLAAVYDQAGRHSEAQEARHRFEELKENKANRETEMLRNVFLKALGGEGLPQNEP
jgi:tetratricopeptide (TPR) repeat protein